MISYIILIKILLGCWFFTTFEPIQDLISNLWSRIPMKISNYYFVDMIYIALGCLCCTVLWTTLIVTGNIWLAMGNAMMAVLIKKILK